MKHFFFSFLVVCVACKSELSPKTSVAPISEVTSSSVVSPFSDELDIANLTRHQWVVEVVLNNGKIDNKSPWLESEVFFLPDGKYTWKGDAFNEKGSYELSPGSNIISLSPRDPQSNSEWSIKYRPEIMVWIGTPTYSHQALQLKLVKKRPI